MVQVDMRQEQVVHAVTCQTLGLQCGQQMRYRRVRTAIDKRGAAAVNDEMGGVEVRAHITGIHSSNAGGVVDEGWKVQAASPVAMGNVAGGVGRRFQVGSGWASQRG